jgi:hypothetical protein
MSSLPCFSAKQWVLLQNILACEYCDMSAAVLEITLLQDVGMVLPHSEFHWTSEAHVLE